ncbi:MAG: cobalamin biosynthesis protein CbiM [Chloroflexi bacterium RBG_16_54_18]|nr:MAG: cobalamin biosynthesis protein CbiM [Chloroflexi bacterium RBG_16_54_18]
MHIPDGFLSVPVSLIMWIVSLVAIAVAIRHAGRELGERQVPLMGVLAAAIFAGQMLNFSVAGGTSGHLMGAAIATILIGPWAAVLVLTTVVGVQALIFQDGGLLAMGSNIFNMGVIGVAVSYFVYQSVRKIAGGRSWGIFAGGFLAAWFSIVIASLAVALQLAVSGTSPANIAVPTMAGIHALIGIGEGLITLGAMSFIYASRRDLLVSGQTHTGSNLSVWVVGLLAAIALAVFAPLASIHPDGLEWVAEQKGFLDLAKNPVYKVIPDYLFPGISNEALATIIAGVIGALLVFGVVIGIAFARRRS